MKNSNAPKHGHPPGHSPGRPHGPLDDKVDAILAQWHRERPDLDVDPMGLFGRLARLHAHLVREKESVFRRHGLSAAGFDVLATLRRAGAPHRLSAGDLLAATMVTSGTMTSRLDQLEKLGLIARTANPHDRRGVMIQLTDKGFATIEAAVTEHVANQHRLVALIDDADRVALDGVLRRYLAAFE